MDVPTGGRAVVYHGQFAGDTGPPSRPPQVGPQEGGESSAVNLSSTRSTLGLGEFRQDRERDRESIWKTVVKLKSIKRQGCDTDARRKGRRHSHGRGSAKV